MTMAMHQRAEIFDIHEDAATEETEMMLDDEHIQELDRATHDEEEILEGEKEEGEQRVEYDDSSEEDNIEDSVQADMDKLQRDFPGFHDKYRLIKRIGEGTFSTVFKAEDLCYDQYDNDWNFEDDSEKWTPPPLKRDSNQIPQRAKKKSRFVAIKKIYVTSSPARIYNELQLLHDLRRCPSVCPLITAFRQTDQVVAILPYFRHGDFRAYFRDMTVPDIAIYLRSLFTALKSVHQHKILHRDIKPTNFLYDPVTQHGVLVDFGLAEREGSDSKPCICHESREARKHRQTVSVWAQTATTQQVGYPKSDTRPSRRANRAGTRGFRAPEVLFKCTEQTTAIDIWSAGVILLTILSKRFPFFNSADDVEAMIEIATIFGSKRMKHAGLLHGCVFETTIPTVGQQGFTMEKIILWSTCRAEDNPLTDEERLAVRFLERCMELDPTRRITAEEALEHELLRIDRPPEDDMVDDDEMDMLEA
ncbi:cell division control protein [Beauveria bassiana ARSEF 2860]|uniref:non-specific serine/threonine protein kinase n=1 Tax=Beauveria bassiana (strain ARSEF 2860) TaxID=655819 RepID=J4WMW6_BEAB2|nr:cell division control protein [Beauveria bassiana ARSEF 2860]EJP71030.1 cell division control protein [Beauveria bassiana ARSEF 2860]